MKQEMKRVKTFGVFLALNKIEEGSEKRVVFHSFFCFRESEKLRCEIILEAGEIFCSRKAF